MNTPARLLLAIILLCGASNIGAAQPPDSCLVDDSLFYEIPSNEIVLVDTCNCETGWPEPGEPVYHCLYARKWFQATFDTLIFDIGNYPDSTAFGWSYVKPWYPSIRDSLRRIEQELGPFYFYRTFPDHDDSSELGSRIFAVRSDRLVNVDSAFTRFERAIPGLWMQFASEPLTPASVEHSPDRSIGHVTIRPDASPGAVVVDVVTRKREHPVRIVLFSLRGEVIFQWNDVRTGYDGRVQLTIDFSERAAGRYFLRVGDSTYPVMIPGSR